MAVDMSIPNSIIAAYLQGLRLRQEREEAVGAMQFRMEDLQRRREEFEQGLEIRNKELDLRSKLNESLIKSRMASEAETKARRALATAQLVNKGILVGQPTEDPDVDIYMGSLLGEGFEDFKAPSATKRARDEAERLQRIAVGAGQKAGAVAGATQPYKTALAELQSKLIGGRQEAQLKGQLANQLALIEKKQPFEIQKMNKAHELKMKEIAAQIQGRIDLKKTPGAPGTGVGAAGIEGLVEDSLGQVMRGELTEEGLRGIDMKTRSLMKQAYIKLGVQVLTNKENQSLGVMGRLWDKFAKLERAFAIMKEKGDPISTQANSEYRDLVAEWDSLAAELREATGERGAVTEGDVDRFRDLRLTTATVPGQMLEKNTERLKGLKDFLTSKQREYMSRFTNTEQRNALIERHNLRAPQRRLRPVR